MYFALSVGIRCTTTCTSHEWNISNNASYTFVAEAIRYSTAYLRSVILHEILRSIATAEFCSNFMY